MGLYRGCELPEAAFQQDLLVANKDPYGAGWLVGLRPTNPESERGQLLTGDEALRRYRRRIDTLKINCFRCAE